MHYLGKFIIIYIIFTIPFIKKTTNKGCRHTGNDIAGKNLANPTALILSSIMMLRYLNLPRFADLITEGLKMALNEKKVRTKDIGGSSTCEEFTEEIIKRCSSLMKI